LANNEIRRLKRRGIEATINLRTVPRVNLYTIGTDGTLECRNAETGEPVWLVRVGDRRLPYRDIGTNEQYLTVINGANLIQVEAATGEVIVEVRMSGTPRFGAVNSGDFAMIPTIGGGVEGYPLYDATRDPFMEIVAGSALSLPTKAPASTKIAWATDRGFVYVMEMEGTPSVEFRLNTDGIVSGRIASATGDRFFFGSEAGQVYGLRATRSGKVLWSQPFGEPFYNEPIVVGDQVLIRSAYGNLFSLSVEDGSMTWDRPTPNVSELIGSFGGRIFITTLSGSFAVIDLETGSGLGVFNEIRPGNPILVNKWTDRLYLVSESGDVQCLRPEDTDIPTFNIQPDIQPKQVVAAKLQQQAAPTPFGAGANDPFGAGGNDPFGAGADPFGSGGDDPMADPFGGGDASMDDPFGGNPFGN
jgi:outer membrane protein assembly factor BamB